MVFLLIRLKQHAMQKPRGRPVAVGCSLTPLRRVFFRYNRQIMMPVRPGPGEGPATRITCEPITFDTFSVTMPPDTVKEKGPPMRRVRGLVVAVALFAGLFTPALASQTQGHAERKAVVRVAPVYPETAKRYGIKGVVRLEVVVRANGSVTSTKVLGGNPVLIGSATDAVRNWKFEAAPDETTEIVQLTFEPH
jgi:TonB family protein